MAPRNRSSASKPKAADETEGTETQAGESIETQEEGPVSKLVQSFQERLDAAKEMNEAAKLELDTEILNRETELDKLYELRGYGRGESEGEISTPRRAAAKRGRPAGTSTGARVAWDEVFSTLPARFTIEHVLKHPGARRKGKAQIYPALTRWKAQKLVKPINGERGVYQKIKAAA